MSGAGLLRTQRRELRLPEAQDVWLDSGQPRNVADPEVQLIRNLGGGRAGNVFLRVHGVPLILVSLLVGIHPVRESLRAGHPLDRVLIAKGAGGPRLQELISLCRERGVPVRFEPREQLDRAANGAQHPRVTAYGSA